MHCWLSADFMNKTTLDKLIHWVADVTNVLNQTCEASTPWQTTSLGSSTKTQCNFLHIIRLPKANLLNNKLLPHCHYYSQFRPPLCSRVHPFPVHFKTAGERQILIQSCELTHHGSIYLNWERNLPGVKNDINLLYD